MQKALEALMAVLADPKRSEEERQAARKAIRVLTGSDESDDDGKGDEAAVARAFAQARDEAFDAALTPEQRKIIAKLDGKVSHPVDSGTAFSVGFMTKEQAQARLAAKRAAGR
ncbi:MAG: hypothetical protein ACRENE_25855 [Polyangiaceae bacterium]